MDAHQAEVSVAVPTEDDTPGEHAAGLRKKTRQSTVTAGSAAAAPG